MKKKIGTPDVYVVVETKEPQDIPLIPPVPSELIIMFRVQHRFQVLLSVKVVALNGYARFTPSVEACWKHSNG